MCVSQLMHDLCRNLLILHRQPSTSQPGPSCQSTSSSASQPGRQPVTLDPAASQPGLLPVNMDCSKFCYRVTEHGRPPVMSTEVSTVKSGDIHYWSVDHHRYNICTLTSVITEEFLCPQILLLLCCSQIKSCYLIKGHTHTVKFFLNKTKIFL